MRLLKARAKIWQTEGNSLLFNRLQMGHSRSWGEEWLKIEFSWGPGRKDADGKAMCALWRGSRPLPSPAAKGES